MTTETERLYRAWREAAEQGYGNPRGGADSPGRMAKIDAKIRRARDRFEAALRAEKGA